MNGATRGAAGEMWKSKKHRRKLSRKSRNRRIKPRRARPEGRWRRIFDAKPMAEGMPPAFLLKLLKSQDAFIRHGRLLTASVWLQSQMVGVICLHDSEDLRDRCTVENGRHLPGELGKATLRKLEELSSESLRREFMQRFQNAMSEQLREDVTVVPLYRDALAHGYLSLRQQIIGPQSEGVFWSPRSSRVRDEALGSLYGPRSEDTFLVVSLSEPAFKEELTRICRVMDFIALKLKDWGIHYPVFA